jgi:hypothetical protein
VLNYSGEKVISLDYGYDPQMRAGCGFRKETIAGMRRNGRDAPKPAVHRMSGTDGDLAGSGDAPRVLRSAPIDNLSWSVRLTV